MIEIEDRETIVVASTIVASVLAVAYWMSRIGFQNPSAPILRSLGLCLVCIAVPYWGSRALRRGGRTHSWYNSQPFLTIAVPALLALAGYLGAGPAFALIAGIGGAALCVFTLARWAMRGPAAATAGVVLVSLTFAGWAAGVVWTSRYKTPLYWEIFSTTANLHHDPLYNVAMGNMMETYGVPSTGLDGTPYAFYHYGSAWVFAQLSKLVGTSLLTFYSLGYAVILIPLFVASILLFALEARGSANAAYGRSLRKNWLAALVLGAGAIGLIPESGLFGMAVWNAHVLISESYLAALPVFFCGVAAVLAYWRTDSSLRSSSGAPILFFYLYLPLLTAALGFLKVSLMILFAAAAFYAALRVGVLRRPGVLLSGGLMAVAAALTYGQVSLAEHNGGISPFNFIRYQTADGWQQFFPLVHFFWTWAYVALRVWEERISSLEELRTAFSGTRMLDVELLLVLAVLGFLPGQILDIHGGSAIYFSDVQRWVAISLMMTRIAGWVATWRRRKAVTGPGEPMAPTIRAGSLSPMLILGAFLLAPFAVTMALNAVLPPLRLVSQNLRTRATVVAMSDSSAQIENRSVRGRMFDPASLAAGVSNGRYAALVSALRDIEKLPRAERSSSALFIPQSYSLYWEMFSADDRCSYVSLVAPAVAAVALIDGMPPYGCEVTDQYNMTAYAPRTRRHVAEDAAPASVCAKARGKGFRYVLILAPDSAGRPHRDRFDCRTGMG